MFKVLLVCLKGWISKKNMKRWIMLFFSYIYLPILQSQMGRWLGNNEEMVLIIKKCTTLLFLLFFMNCVLKNGIMKKMKQNISQYMKEGGCKSVWYSTTHRMEDQTAYQWCYVWQNLLPGWKRVNWFAKYWGGHPCIVHIEKAKWSVNCW